MIILGCFKYLELKRTTITDKMNRIIPIIHYVNFFKNNYYGTLDIVIYITGLFD